MAKAKPVTKKKSTAKKPSTTKKKTSSKTVSKNTKGNLTQQNFLTAKPSTRRPPNNPDMPFAGIENLNQMLIEMRTILDDYSQHLRALDRKRLNGVGIRKLGFIERASFEHINTP